MLTLKTIIIIHKICYSHMNVILLWVKTRITEAETTEEIFSVG